MKVRSERFRLKPNLSVRPKEIALRLNNGTLTLSPGEQEQWSEELTDFNRMSKIDIERKRLEGSRHIQDLKNKLRIDEDLRQLAKKETIGDHSKIKKDGPEESN